MDHVTPCKGASNFNEDSILFTPLPQATSTVDKRPDLLPLPEIMMEPELNSPDLKNTYLSDGLSVINDLRQKLDNLITNNTNDATNELTKKNYQQDDIKKSVSTISGVIGIQTINEAENKNKEVPNDSLQSSNDVIKISSCQTASSKNNLADISVPSSDRNLSSYKPINVSLPVLPGSDFNFSIPTADLSLPIKNNEKEKPFGFDRPSFMSSAFTPLLLVPDEIKRNTYKLDVLSNTEEAERSSAREKALKVISALDLVPAKEFDCSNSSVPSLVQKSFDQSGKDNVSGFSQLMNKSDFDKDEAACVAKYGLPIKPSDESFSFLSASQVSLDFMPPDDSLLRELGPADPPKFKSSEINDFNFSTVSETNYNHLLPQETPKTSLTYVKNEKMRESSRNVKDLFSELESSVCSSIVPGDLDDYLKYKNISLESARSLTNNLRTPKDDSVSDIRVSDIAKALQDVPIDATPNSLAKKVMELSDRPSAEKSVQGNNDFEQLYYEKNVVYGGIVHVDLHTDSPSPHTLWNFQDLILNQVKGVIKSSNNPVKVLLFPLVRKNIVVKVQEVEFDRNDRYFARLHVIKLLVEHPQVEVIGGPDLDFNRVPECGSVRLPITLRCYNSNVLVICPKFQQEEFSLFSVEYEDEHDEEIHLPPKQDVVVKIVIKPTMGFCKDVNNIKCVSDQLNLCLSPMLGSEILIKIPLKASVYHCRLQVQDSLLEQPICPGEERQVHFKNSSPCPVNLKLRATGRFNLSVSNLALKSLEISSVKISYFPPPDAVFMEGELILTIVPGGLDHFIKLKGKGSQADFSFTNAQDSTRSSSALGSTNTSMSINSSTEPDGALELECTSVFLVWPSVGLGNTSTIKSCYIRSKGSCKEKLLIEIKDPSNSFFLVTNERESKKSEVVVLNPHERRKLSVEFSPKLFGQLKAHIVIRRVKSKCDVDSKQIILFGFGGCGNLRALNMVLDLVTRQLKLSLKSNLTQQFALQNFGDGLAFFSFSQKKLEGMHLAVNPLNGLIGQGEVCTVNLTLQADITGSENAFFQQLLCKDKSTDIVLSSLTIIYGDESTRLRLARLYRKYKNQSQFLKSPQVTFALKNLSELFSVTRQKMEIVSSLKDPLTSLYDLFNEGIQELMIDVTIPRNCLEEANLEVTQKFVNFPEHSQLDETEYTTFLETTNHPSHIAFN